jgi:hypothetical protein
MSKDKSKGKGGKGDNEYRRTLIAGYMPEFVTPEQYIEFKLLMLRKEMYIEPTEDEIKHLYELKTEGDIDRAVHGIIYRAWN